MAYGPEAGWASRAFVAAGRVAARGFDPVPDTLRADASPLTPWRYGVWRMRPVCEAVAPEDETNSSRP